MRLAELTAGLSDAQRRGDPDITSVAIRSDRVAPGALFCCVRGRSADGHDHAADAVARGAAALLVDRWLDVDVAQVKVDDVRRTIGRLASVLEGEPSKHLVVVGVTGTNGKTTVTHLLADVLNHAGHPCAVIGTLGGAAPGEPPTTPDAPQLQRLLAAARDDGRATVAMEVSSHALDQGRVEGVRFGAGVFTNLSHDHLDYHHSIDEYAAAKAALFTAGRCEWGVINVADEWGARIAAATDIPVAPYRPDDAEDVETHLDRMSMTWRGRRLHVAVGGRFNVANVVAAATTAEVLGLGLDQIVSGLGAVSPVPGRFESVVAGQPFGVIVDYAHTPDGVRAVVAAAREVAPSGRVTLVVGAGGDRDRDKRPEMGEAAGSADRVVLTSDNPRSESPGAIITAMQSGLPAGANVTIEPDRRAAIAQALAVAEAGDVVVVAGKGHETYQEIDGDRVPFDDRVVAREALAALGFGEG